jgi:hypothetical protein
MPTNTDMPLKKKMAADFGCGHSEWNTYDVY